MCSRLAGKFDENLTSFGTLSDGLISGLTGLLSVREGLKQFTRGMDLLEARFFGLSARGVLLFCFMAASACALGAGAPRALHRTCAPLGVEVQRSQSSHTIE